MFNYYLRISILHDLFTTLKYKLVFLDYVIVFPVETIRSITPLYRKHRI